MPDTRCHYRFKAAEGNTPFVEAEVRPPQPLANQRREFVSKLWLTKSKVTHNYYMVQTKEQSGGLILGFR